MHLLSLIGEQPIPNLLVARALQAESNLLCCTPTTQRIAYNLRAMLPNAEIHHVEPYHLENAIAFFDKVVRADTLLNLTGGTKPMALAAFEVARQKRLPFVYLQSEGGKSILYHYDFKDGSPVLKDRRTLGTLIDVEDYLRAHGLKANAEKGPQNAQEAGLRHWLEKYLDEIHSNMVFEAFEIDFILRRGNQVCVMEAKMTRQNTRKGIDQLNTFTGRDYLGTYTGKILAVGKPLGPQLARLAEARHIQVVLLAGNIDHRTGRLTLSSASRQALLSTLDRLLGGIPERSTNSPLTLVT